VTDQQALIARANAAGSTVIERWYASHSPATIF
jgi:hypothetical protein